MPKKWLHKELEKLYYYVEILCSNLGRVCVYKQYTWISLQNCLFFPILTTYCTCKHHLQSSSQLQGSATSPSLCYIKSNKT